MEARISEPQASRARAVLADRGRALPEGPLTVAQVLVALVGDADLDGRPDIDVGALRAAGLVEGLDPFRADAVEVAAPPSRFDALLFQTASLPALGPTAADLSKQLPANAVELPTRDAGQAAYLLYGDPSLAPLLEETAPGVFRIQPSLLTPKLAAARATAIETWVRERADAALAQKDDPRAFAGAVAGLLDELAAQPDGMALGRHYLAAVTQELAPGSTSNPLDILEAQLQPGWSATLLGSPSERTAPRGELLAAYLNLYGAAMPQLVERAAQLVLRDAGSPSSGMQREVSELLGHLDGPMLGAVLFRVGLHHRDLEGGFDPEGPARHVLHPLHKEPTPEGLIQKVLESLPEADRERVLGHAVKEGVFSEKDAEEIRRGRGWYESTYPFNHLAAHAERRAEHWAEQANQGSAWAHVAGTFWAALDREAGGATVSTLGTLAIGAGIGAGLEALAASGLRGAATAHRAFTVGSLAAGTFSSSFMATWALQEAITGRDAVTGAPLRPEDRTWGRIPLVLAGSLLVVGGTVLAVRAGRSGRPEPRQLEKTVDWEKWELVPELSRGEGKVFVEVGSPEHQLIQALRARGGARTGPAPTRGLDRALSEPPPSAPREAGTRFRAQLTEAHRARVTAEATKHQAKATAVRRALEAARKARDAFIAEHGRAPNTGELQAALEVRVHGIDDSLLAAAARGKLQAPKPPQLRSPVAVLEKKPALAAALDRVLAAAPADEATQASLLDFLSKVADGKVGVRAATEVLTQYEALLRAYPGRLRGDMVEHLLRARTREDAASEVTAMIEALEGRHGPPADWVEVVAESRVQGERRVDLRIGRGGATETLENKRLKPKKRTIDELGKVVEQRVNDALDQTRRQQEVSAADASAVRIDASHRPLPADYPSLVNKLRGRMMQSHAKWGRPSVNKVVIAFKDATLIVHVEPDGSVTGVVP